MLKAISEGIYLLLCLLFKLSNCGGQLQSTIKNAVGEFVTVLQNTLSLDFGILDSFVVDEFGLLLGLNDNSL